MEDWFDARAVNQAVWHFGTALEAALAAAEDKGKTRREKIERRKAVLSRWLAPSSGARQYRDPASTQNTSRRL